MDPLKDIFTDPNVSSTVREAARLIIDNPGKDGRHIANAIFVSRNHFYRDVVPVLKKHGFTSSRRRNGYAPPTP